MTNIQQTANSIFCANALLGEVVDATCIDSRILLDDEGFRLMLASFAGNADVPFNELASDLISYANNNF